MQTTSVALVVYQSSGSNLCLVGIQRNDRQWNDMFQRLLFFPGFTTFFASLVFSFLCFYAFICDGTLVSWLAFISSKVMKINLLSKTSSKIILLFLWLKHILCNNTRLDALELSKISFASSFWIKLNGIRKIVSTGGDFKL